MNEKKTFNKIGILLLVLAVFFGCAPSIGRFSQETGTGVTLSKNNYKVIKESAIGESSGFNFLGIIPIVSPSYADAKKALYDSIGEDVRGKSLALANQTEDRSTLYLILFSIPKITISADVIEFQKE